jgi:Tfp pilus assembly protein PilX
LIARKIARRAGAEQGFTMVAVMGILLIVGLLSVAAFAAANGDLKPGADDKRGKAAYSAAEAGVNDYMARLIADTDFWTKCADPSDPALNGKNPATRNWATIPGSSAQYSIELLPANSAAQCTVGNAQATFIDSSTGTFRIRSTGRSSSTSAQNRSIISTFRRKGFLDYVYFTDYETMNPAFYFYDANGNQTREDQRPGGLPIRDVVQWAADQCTKYWRDGRGSERFVGHAPTAGQFMYGQWFDWTTQGCDQINFITGDGIKGPAHSNDSFQLCGSPVFGRSPSDDIEVSAPGPSFPADPGYQQGCSGSPQVNDPASAAPVNPNWGTWRKNAPLVTLPPSNSSLKDDALPNYRFKGKTSITLNGSTMTVTGKRENGTQLNNVSLPVPTDGVVYVSNDPAGSCSGYSATVLDPVNLASQYCGDAWVKGSYSGSMTISAENDIVVEANVTSSGDTLLGLISNNFIRVYHPVTIYGPTDCDNNGGPGSITIEAAILSLRNSFTVDRWWCGGSLGTLTVKGAIAQKYRGTVGRGSSGYLKNYQYDDRLKFRSPPRFLDPVQAGWKIQSYVEQVPASR